MMALVCPLIDMATGCNSAKDVVLLVVPVAKAVVLGKI